jgi:hypothetical protein
MCWRVELRSQLIGRKVVVRGLKSVFLVGVWLVRSWVHRWGKLRSTESVPNWNGWVDRMRQIHVFRVLQRFVVDTP